jgi:hypothetical protein
MATRPRRPSMGRGHRGAACEVRKGRRGCRVLDRNRQKVVVFSSAASGDDSQAQWHIVSERSDSVGCAGCRRDATGGIGRDDGRRPVLRRGRAVPGLRLSWRASSSRSRACRGPAPGGHACGVHGNPFRPGGLSAARGSLLPVRDGGGGWERSGRWEGGRRGGRVPGAVTALGTRRRAGGTLPSRVPPQPPPTGAEGEAASPAG